jgi:hypothetical protein
MHTYEMRGSASYKGSNTHVQMKRVSTYEEKREHAWMKGREDAHKLRRDAYMLKGCRECGEHAHVWMKVVWCA